MTSLADQALNLIKEVQRCRDFLQPIREEIMRYEHYEQHYTKVKRSNLCHFLIFLVY